MFLIPKNNLNSFDPERCCFVLNEFSAAEYASALEMLFAAKNVDDLKVKMIKMVNLEPNSYIEMTKYCRKHAETSFSDEKIIQRYKSLSHSLNND